MTWRSSTLDTAVGPFTAIVDGEGAVLASGWTADVDALLPLIHPSIRPAGRLRSRRDLGAVTTAIRAYHAGEVGAPCEIPVHQHSGAAFLAAAWKALRDVPPGGPITYIDLAARTGNPAASRAAAQACARNAAALFVPCHRVVRVGGGIGGFRWGTRTKEWLLAHESGRRIC